LLPEKEEEFLILEEGGVNMCKKLSILCVALVVVVLSVPVLADISASTPLLVDVNGRYNTTTYDGWQAWYFASPWASNPVSQTFIVGSQTVTCTMKEVGSTAGKPYDARERDGGMTFVAGTGEYSQTGKGLGMNYLQLQIDGLDAASKYGFRLWSYDYQGAWVYNANNPNKVFGVWATQNPLVWLGDNGYDGSTEGEPAEGGYGPKDVDGGAANASSDTNMPAGLAALVAAHGARIDMNRDSDPGDSPLAGWSKNMASFTAYTNASGSIKIYGWNDNTDYLNSMHMLLNAFTIIPEPATVALLGLGGLALLRRKRA